MMSSITITKTIMGQSSSTSSLPSSTSTSPQSSSSSIKVNVFDFNKNDYHTIIIPPPPPSSSGEQQQQNFSIIYAEDLIFYLTSKTLKITTICAHLFGLYNVEMDLWLAPNQPLHTMINELSFTSNPSMLQFQLRIRFTHVNLINKLKVSLMGEFRFSKLFF